MVKGGRQPGFLQWKGMDGEARATQVPGVKEGDAPRQVSARPGMLDRGTLIVCMFVDCKSSARALIWFPLSLDTWTMIPFLNNTCTQDRYLRFSKVDREIKAGRQILKVE